MVNQKTSLLVAGQLPEYIVDEFPNFVSFLEAYYEYLENKQGTQKNDLVSASKELRYITDVDHSIEDFENSFFNSFATLIPRDVKVDKAILLKHIMPLYLSKGSEKSFKLLFKLLFNEDVQIVQPKLNVLRASDGQWLVENAFRISEEVYSTYIGDGKTTVFKMVSSVPADQIEVYVNDVLQTTGFHVRRETRKVVFDTAPANGASISVLYQGFDYQLLNNRKITGLTSGAYALVERTAQKTINFIPTFELYINKKTLVGDFVNGENVVSDVVDADGVLISVKLKGLSLLKTINVVEGGSSYNVGDPVIITGGNATRDAKAVVSEVFSGFINQIDILAGGSGFKTGSNVNLIGADANSALVLAIDGVDTSGVNFANTYMVNTDRIADYASLSIGAADYGFPSSPVDNINSRIVDTLTYGTVSGIGAITNVTVLFANSIFKTVPTLDAVSAAYTAGGQSQYLQSLGAIGKIVINDGGIAYTRGDELEFTTPAGGFGFGAAAVVANTTPSGTITAVDIQPPRISGLGTITDPLCTVIGTNTLFKEHLAVGDKIIINNQTRYVNSIASNTSFNVNVNFTYTESARKIGKYEWLPNGGQSYTNDFLPTVNVTSVSGSGANISAYILGDGERLLARSDKNPGAILKIRITDAGTGYEFFPVINLTQSGDGTATANSLIETSYVTFPGRWTTSDSILSAAERVIQGRDYYVDYSYVMSSKVEFSKFKDVYNNLIHPAGFINYAEFRIDDTVRANASTVESQTTYGSVSGLVSVNSSVYITGTNTNFTKAQSLGLIGAGYKIAVNSEIRVIDTILDPVSIKVTSPFTITTDLEELVIVDNKFFLSTESDYLLTTEDGTLLLTQ